MLVPQHIPAIRMDKLSPDMQACLGMQVPEPGMEPGMVLDKEPDMVLGRVLRTVQRL